MSEHELPGRRLMSKDLVISNPREFLEQVPQLIAQLRLRIPTRAWGLDLSPASLIILDEYLGREVDRILDQGLEVDEVIDRDLLKEVTAYVGEIFRHDKGAVWRVSSEHPNTGPRIVFQVAESSTGARRPKAIDVYHHVLKVVVAGESLSRWYDAEKE